MQSPLTGALIETAAAAAEGPWHPGWLLPAGLLWFAAGHAVGAALFPAEGQGKDRVLAGQVLGLTMPMGLVTLFGLVHLIHPVWLLVATMAIASAALVLVGHGARRRAVADVRCMLELLREALRSGTSAWGLMASGLAVGLAVLSAGLIGPWAWDALGYHLPIVNDALQTHTLRTVPCGVVYVNHYPRSIDLFTVWFRALLPHDRWIELAQLPFGLACTSAIAAFAARGGARPARAMALAPLWLAVPAVVLQLCANYVDVGHAALLLLAAWFASGPLTRPHVTVGAFALGAFLASKPSAPVPFVIFAVVLGLRAFREQRLGRFVMLMALATVLGSHKYVANFIAVGNPVWPVRVHLGPWTLPGLHEMGPMYEVGLVPPYREQGWLLRLLNSWSAWRVHYAYDMRIGGLAPLVPFVLVPLCLLRCRTSVLSRIGWPLLTVALGALASRGAFWPRYVLAVPAALLAAAIAMTESEPTDAHASSGHGVLRGRWPARWRMVTDGVMVVAAMMGLVLAYPGFTASGPRLHTMLRLSPAQRLDVVSFDGHEREWVVARHLVGPDGAFGYDVDNYLLGQLQRSDGRGRLVFRPDDVVDRRTADAWISRERVRVLAATPSTIDSLGLTDRTERFFKCPESPCTVYVVK